MKIKLLRPGAKTPTRAKPGDSGLDAFACLGGARISLRAGGRAVIPLGIAAAVPEGWEIQVRPRSGLASRGIVAELGTVDSGYRGEISACLRNDSEHTHQIHDGDRVCQLVIAPIWTGAPELVEELDETERGAGGFGSTGT